MKISGKKPPVSADVVRLQKISSGGTASHAAGPAVSDKVDLSGKAMEIRELVGAVKGLPEIRTAKVEGIKGRIDSGEYAVDPEKVAERIIDEIV